MWADASEGAMELEPDRVIKRHLESVIADRLPEEPVVVLTGARTVGKSTLLAACARAHRVSVIDLDNMSTRRAVETDPTLYVSGPVEPICIDEFQHVPALLDAIKAELNQGLRPGRYLLAGSTRYQTLPRASQSLTGRAHPMTLWPLSQGELRGQKENFLDQLVTDPEVMVRPTPSGTTRADYETLILAGGFPVAMTRGSPAARGRWFRDLVQMVVDRDVLELRRVRQRRVLPLILRQLASQTAGLLNVAEVANRVQLNGRLVADYVMLLESVYLVQRLEAFGRTISSRVGRSPKIHIVDSGLAAYLLGVNERKLHLRDSAALTEFGHVVETFTVNELIKQAGWSTAQVQFAHYRTRDGSEVDLVIQTDDGVVAGVEVKASSTVARSDMAGLRTLRDRLGSDFVGGVVLYLGQRTYSVEDRIHVLPLDFLWT